MFVVGAGCIPAHRQLWSRRSLPVVVWQRWWRRKTTAPTWCWW